MIFIGGIQPKTITVDATPRMCPSCGLVQARLKRIDSYLSLFFIPLFRVQKGEPFLYCERCQGPVSPVDWQKAASPRCPYCGQSVDREFQFCPYCGERVKGKG